MCQGYDDMFGFLFLLQGGERESSGSRAGQSTCGLVQLPNFTFFLFVHLCQARLYSLLWFMHILNLVEQLLPRQQTRHMSHS